MLEAKKSAWFEALFSAYNRNLIRRRFASLRVAGAETLPRSASSIIFANHSSWWDGLVCHLLLRELGIDPYVMMEEANLMRYPLFRRIGAFSIDRTNARAALRSIDYAAGLLNNGSPKSVLMFPQGKIEPEERSPIAFESGILRLIDRAPNCPAVPLAIRYRFCDKFKPEIFVSVGRPVALPTNNEKPEAADLAVLIENELARLGRDLEDESFGQYTDLI